MFSEIIKNPFNTLAVLVKIKDLGKKYKVSGKDL